MEEQGTVPIWRLMTPCTGLICTPESGVRGHILFLWGCLQSWALAGPEGLYSSGCCLYRFCPSCDFAWNTCLAPSQLILFFTAPCARSTPSAGGSLVPPFLCYSCRLVCTMSTYTQSTKILIPVNGSWGKIRNRMNKNRDAIHFLGEQQWAYASQREVMVRCFLSGKCRLQT